MSTKGEESDQKKGERKAEGNDEKADGSILYTDCQLVVMFELTKGDANSQRNQNVREQILLKLPSSDLVRSPTRGRSFYQLHLRMSHLRVCLSCLKVEKKQQSGNEEQESH